MFGQNSSQWYSGSTGRGVSLTVDDPVLLLVFAVDVPVGDLVDEPVLLVLLLVFAVDVPVGDLVDEPVLLVLLLVFAVDVPVGDLVDEPVLLVLL